MAEQVEMRQLVRLIDADLPGARPIGSAIRKVTGVSFAMARAVCMIASIDPTKLAGLLSESELKSIESVLRNPAQHKVPSWMINRRKDYETGVDKHIVSNEVRLTRDFDIKRMRMMRSYKGNRHGRGLPVRGQKTKAHFRHGSSLGIKKKKDAKGGRV